MSTTLPRGLAAASALAVAGSSDRPSRDAAISICCPGSSDMPPAAVIASARVGGSFLTRSLGSCLLRLLLAVDRMATALYVVLVDGMDNDGSRPAAPARSLHCTIPSVHTICH